MTVRTRFAPSPTGRLHIGGVRTALFNLLLARHSGGRFVLRMDDTDRVRSKRAFEDAIMEDLRWLGLLWDEGPDVGGTFGPYRQSERLGLYIKEAERLFEGGLAYRCWCTEERLEALRRERLAAGLPPRYDGRCRDLPPEEAPRGVRPAIRFRVPELKISFEDLVHGRVDFDACDIGDFIIVSSDGTPSYNFATAVDDALMEITHVLRGDDHLSNTPRQILVQEALGLKKPVYGHIPLVTGPDGRPLSKRHGKAAVAELREEGYLPPAVLNAAARLGWSPGERLLTLEEMAKTFNPGALSKSPALFDTSRLRAFNKRAIEAADPALLVELSGTGPGPKEYLIKVIELVRPNAATINELKELAAPFIGEAEYREEALSVLERPASKAGLGAFLDRFEAAKKLDREVWERVTKEVSEATGLRGKDLFLPLRCALTGATRGPELEGVAMLLGRERVVERIKRALKPSRPRKGGRECP